MIDRLLNAIIAAFDRVSNLGCDQSDPYILGEADACVIGKHAAIRNADRQLRPHVHSALGRAREVHMYLIGSSTRSGDSLPCVPH